MSNMRSMTAANHAAIQGQADAMGPMAWMMGVVEQVRMAAQRRTAVAELNALDDRMLQDIGVKRSEIPGIIYGCSRDVSRHLRA